MNLDYEYVMQYEIYEKIDEFFTNNLLCTQISCINAFRILLLSGLSTDYPDNSNFGRQTS